ncbi:hypothetical protein SP90_01830 [Halodesulfovibrio spirochaetisodalis]|uniref:Uncharacterized protein n=1 Tax=Halodesulfovibrio spirochaetisodalis TaxID=1560234 RepID=A0A1B7XMU1_9BACT|nr:hypothetical protein SP90_01830 [Halodesulfovibrio spirochaetisodalis]
MVRFCIAFAKPQYSGTLSTCSASCVRALLTVQPVNIHGELFPFPQHTVVFENGLQPAISN